MRCKAERDLGEAANRVMWAVRVFPPPVRAGANCVNRQAMTPACKQRNTKTLQIDNICFGLHPSLIERNVLGGTWRQHPEL